MAEGFAEGVVDADGRGATPTTGFVVVGTAAVCAGGPASFVAEAVALAEATTLAVSALAGGVASPRFVADGGADAGVAGALGLDDGSRVALPATGVSFVLPPAT